MGNMGLFILNWENIFVYFILTRVIMGTRAWYIQIEEIVFFFLKNLYLGYWQGALWETRRLFIQIEVKNGFFPLKFCI